jgi:hypothetical protein
MRKASVALVPILIAIVVMFWVIWYMGEESDNTKEITQIQKLQALQVNMAKYAISRKIALLQEGKTEEEAEEIVKDEIDAMMEKNKIDTPDDDDDDDD